MSESGQTSGAAWSLLLEWVMVEQVDIPRALIDESSPPDVGVAPPCNPPRITIAEDDRDVREVLADIFIQDGFEVTHLGSGTELVAHLELSRDTNRLPDLIVVDHRMPGFCGVDVIEALRHNDWTLPIILMTAFGVDVGNRAQAMGASAVFHKPFDLGLMRTVVDCLIEAPGPNRARAGNFDVEGAMPLGPRCSMCHTAARVRVDDALGVAVCVTCLSARRALS